MKTTKMLGVGTIVVIAALLATNVLAENRGKGRGNGPIVYVESQGLYYDSIVLADLPPNGRFQLLKTETGPTGLATMYGPGDVGYLGGRWWVDVNGDSAMDEGDLFFLCPLLGPGRLDP